MEETESISCIAVGDMLRKRLEEYTEALASGVDKSTLDSMENDIDRIEAVHNKCVADGDVTDIGTSHAEDVSSIVVDDAEGEGDVGDSVDSIDDWSRRVFDEEDGN